MHSFFAKKLTELTGHYIDWSQAFNFRIFNSFTSGNFHLNEQVIKSTTMMLMAAASSYIAAQLNNPEKTQCSNLTLSIATGTTTLILAHIVVIYPTYKKRVNMQKKCDELVGQIESKMEDNSEITREQTSTIRDIVKQIRELSLSNDKNSNASQTWGRRINLLTKVDEHLSEFDTSFWRDSAEVIMENLNKQKTISYGKRS